MKVQIITTPSGEELVILPRSDFDALMAQVAETEEDAADVAAFDAAMAALEDVGPAEDSADTLLRHGMMKAIRKQRGLTQAALAEAAGVAQGFLSEIEAGRKKASPDTLTRIAAALDVPPEQIGG